MFKQIKRLLTLALAVCLTVPAGLPVLAAKEPVYEARVSGGKLQLVTDAEVTGSYTLKNSVMTLTESQGDLALEITEKNSTVKTSVLLDATTKLHFRGGISSLTIDKSVLKGKTLTISGQVTTLVVNAPVKLVIPDTGRVNRLTVTARAASVSIDDEAKVKNISAVRLESISGSNDVTKLAETSGGYKEPTYLEIEDAEEQKYTREISVDTGDKNILSLTAKNGSTLSRAMKDVRLLVFKEADDKKVSGRWAWTTDCASTTKTGVYLYEYTPTDATMQPVALTVEYTGTGTDGKYTKPSLGFSSGQPRFGAANKDVGITIGIPKQTEDEDTLTIYLGSDVIASYELSDSDAGESSDYKVPIGNGISGDKLKIKVKIKRSYGGASATSKTIIYEIK